MKIALVHDYIKEYGGAERVLEALHELYPDAPVFTSVYLPEYLGPHRERFKGWDIRESWGGKVPFINKLISPLRIVSPLLFKSFDFSEFDVIITSATGAYFPNTLNKQSAKLVCYCHTPPRYLYGYATAREWKKNWVVRIIGEIANHFLRMVDFKAAQNVDYFIANSKEVQSRIKKFYRREARVIYPPVNTAFSSLASSVQLRNKKLNANKLDAKRYFLAGGRLARPKNIDLIVRACREHNLPLKVFGKDFAGYGEELKIQPFDFPSTPLRAGAQGKDSKIEFVGEVTDEEKLYLMKNAKAYIFASEDEDFGITPVEAMSIGTPVIAYRSGGVQESVLQGRTGIFFDELTVKSLIKTIKSFGKLRINAEDCIRQAQKFSKERFKTEIQTFIATHYSQS